MLVLREYRQTASLLADHLPWAALVADGVILNKDGSFQRTLKFRGPDLESATEAELIATSARANNVLKRFGSGWALFFEADRVPAIGYPQSPFPDAASWLVDQERRSNFNGTGKGDAYNQFGRAHFESHYYLTLVWMPPADQGDSAARALVERSDGIQPLSNLSPKSDGQPTRPDASDRQRATFLESRAGGGFANPSLFSRDRG